MKLSIKLFVILSIFLTIVTAPLDLFLYYTSIQATQKQIEKNLQKRASYGIEKIDRFLFERTADMRIISSDYAILSFLDNPSRLVNELLKYHHAYKAYSSLSVFNSERIKIADTDSIGIGEKASNRAWVTTVFDEEKLSIAADIGFSEELGRNIILFAAPLKDNTGKLLGAVTANVPIENIQKILWEPDADDVEIHVDLVNKTGLLLYSNYNPKGVLKQTVSLDALEAFFSSHDENPVFYTIAKEAGYLDFQGNGWTLITHYSQKEVFADAIALRNQAIILSTVLLLITMLGIFLLTHQLVKPISLLRDAAIKIGQGDFSSRVVLSSRDEIGLLAQTFNQTSALLEDSVNKLSQFKVAFDNMAVMVFIIDGKTLKFSYVNQAAVDQLHFSEQELLQMTPLQLDAILSVEQIKNFIEHVIKEKQQVKFETALKRKEGSIFPAEMSIQYVSFKEIGYFIAIGQDITERKRNESIIKEFNQRLQEEVAHQTEELAAQNEELLSQSEDLLRNTQLLQQEVIKREQIEESLRKSEELFSLAIRAVNDGIWDFDPKTHYTYYTPAAKRMLGLSEDANLTIEQFVKLIHPDDFQQVWNAFSNYIAKKADNYDACFRVLHCRGEYIWVRARATAVWNENGEAIRVVGTHSNVSDQKQMEKFLKEYNQKLEQEVAEQTQALREKTEILEKEQEKFTAVLNSLESVVYVADLKTYQVLFVNQYSERIFGNDLIGKFCWQTLQKEGDRPCSFCTNDRLLTKEGEPGSVYIWEMKNTINHHWYYMQDRAIRWTDGRIVRLTIATDITKQKEAVDMIRASERKFRELYHNLRDGLASVDMTGKIIEFNPAYQQMVGGYSIDELHNLRYEQLTPVKWHGFETQLIQEQVMIRGYSDLYEKEYIRRDGSIITVELQTYLAKDNQDNPVGMWAIVRDVTERKQAEEALKQAKEAAEIANQAKSAFLANMSHELRTPLNGILGYTQILMRDKTLTVKQQEGIHIIHKSGEYLLTLINDILDLSKIEAGRIELYPTDFHFGEFLQSIVSLFQIRAEQKGIFFIFERLSHLPEGIRADEKRLRQVLINLLANAIKFTQQGGVTFKVGYHEDKIRFQIEDTGIGIPEEQLEDIFLPFHQASDGKFKYEGTGLGLSISQKIVHLMGGEIEVKSTLHRGSMFWLSLDLLEVSHLMSYKGRLQPVVIGYHGKRRAILVIDDKWENRSVMINLLTPIGFIVIETENGQHGLEKALEVKPDLILTDLVMPVMDGFEFARQLRKIKEFESVPIIAASASVFEHHQQQSFAAGCNDFIAKPFKAEELLAHLQCYLNLKWVYENQTELEEESVITSGSGEELIHITDDIRLNKEQSAVLYDLSMSGDILGIKKYLNELEKNDQQLTPLIAKLRQLADNFEDDKIIELLQLHGSL